MTKQIQIKWSKRDVLCLKIWYKNFGDVLISNLLNEFGNSYREINNIKIKKNFKKYTVEKKRFYLGLKRTKEEISKILSEDIKYRSVRRKKISYYDRNLALKLLEKELKVVKNESKLKWHLKTFKKQKEIMCKISCLEKSISAFSVKNEIKEDYGFYKLIKAF